MEKDTLKEAKLLLRKHFDKGMDCPACGQFVRRYRRKLHGNMAHCLIRLYHLDRRERKHYHLRDIMVGVANTGSNDFNKLRIYKLIEPLELTDEEKKKGAKRSSGYWRITEKGRLFVTGAIALPQYVYIYDNRVLEFDKKLVTIHTVLGTKFNYVELMKGI